MAFSRFHRRFARRRRVFRRRVTRTRARPAFRRRFAPRMRRRTSMRRIINTVSTRKSNAMVSTNNANPTTPVVTVNLARTINAYLWCPSFMNHEQQEMTHYVRNTQDVFFKGFQDTWTINSGPGTGNDRWTHRRIVFWSHQQYPAGVPIQNSLSPTLYYRPLNVLDLTNAGVQGFMESVFQGTVNVDYASYLTASVDKRRVALVSDRKIKHEPRYAETVAGGDIGGQLQRIYRTPHFINRTIRYDDEERGDVDVPGDDGEEPGGPGDSHGSPWSVNNPRSAGNLYVLDIFMLGTDGRPPGAAIAGENFAFISTDARVWWHEK